MGLFTIIMNTQQQPGMDTPAIEQAPVIERVLETAKQVQPQQKSKLFWPVVLSYLLSIAGGVSTSLFINILFGSPYNDALIPINETLWEVGIPLSLFVTFILGLILPIIFAKRKRLRAMFLTLLFLFLTLIILVIIGLSQISTEQLFNSLVLE